MASSQAGGKVFCLPACRECVDAGACPKGEVPASAYVRPRPRQPRRAAVAATYPRDVRPVYAHLACGHVTTKEAQVFFSVWRDKGSVQFYCEVCHGWVDTEARDVPISETLW